MNKILDLAKKLKALADRGIGGEKDNADIMLRRLMEKHQITFDMLGENVMSTHQFFMNDEEFKFFGQVASNVCGHGNYRDFTYRYKLKKNSPGLKRRGLECTDIHFIEVMAKHGFYYKAFQDEIKVFYKAFIQKNKLYMKESEEQLQEREASPKSLTPEEKAELFRIASMMDGIERKVFVKQIG